MSTQPDTSYPTTGEPMVDPSEPTAATLREIASGLVAGMPRWASLFEHRGWWAMQVRSEEDGEAWCEWWARWYAVDAQWRQDAAGRCSRAAYVPGGRIEVYRVAAAVEAVTP